MINQGASFDLLFEPWIPCLDAEGSSRELGLIELFESAHQLRAVADPSPLATFAIYRLLLAIVHRVIRGPRTTAEWLALWKQGCFDQAAFTAYFQQWSDRFDLFHPKWPFYQTAGFATVKEGVQTPSPVGRLLPEVAAGHNATLFDHSRDDAGAVVSPAEATRAVLVAHTWGLGGGKGPSSNLFGPHPYMSHAPCIGAVAVIVGGADLFQTLCLNLARVGPDEATPFQSGSQDLPCWERAAPRQPTEQVPDGYLDYLTWQARHLRVKPTATGDGVAEMFIAQGPLVADDLGFENPFAFFRISDTKGRQPVRLDPERAMWRDSAALFAFQKTGEADCRPQALRFGANRKIRQVLGEDARLRVLCFGLANDQAKALSWRREEVPAPIRLLDDPDLVVELDAALGAVEDIWGELRDAARGLAYKVLETDTKKPDARDVTRVSTRLLRHVGFWERVEPGFHRLLQDIGAERRAEWAQEAQRVAIAGLAHAAGFAEGSIARRGRAVALAQRDLARALSKKPSLPTPAVME